MALPVCPRTWKLLCCLVRGQKVGEMPAKPTPKAQPGQTDRTQAFLIPTGTASTPQAPLFPPKPAYSLRNSCHPLLSQSLPTNPAHTPRTPHPRPGTARPEPKAGWHTGVAGEGCPGAAAIEARARRRSGRALSPRRAPCHRQRCSPSPPVPRTDGAGPPLPSADAGLARLFIGAESELILPCSTFSIL